MDNWEFYEAPEDLIYILKGNIKSFGKVVIITNDNDLTIEDYELMDEELHKIELEKIIK